MDRKIKSISVANTENIYTHESKTVVTVNFFAKGFKAAGHRIIERHADGTQTKRNENLSTTEFAAAKALSFRDGKWNDVRDEAHSAKLQRQMNQLSAQRHAEHSNVSEIGYSEADQLEMKKSEIQHGESELAG